MITLRPATAADQDSIGQIIREAGINPMGLNWERFIVAEDNGKIVATGQVKPHRNGTRELASIATIPEYQKQGIATKIIQALLEREKPPLYLMTEHRTAGFYERFGFYKLEPDDIPADLKGFYRLGNLMGRLYGLFRRERFYIVIMKQSMPQPTTEIQ